MPTRTTGPGSNGLPPWINALAALVALGLLVYSVVVLGPEGYPTTVVVGGLLAGLFGINRLLGPRPGTGGTSPSTDNSPSSSPSTGTGDTGGTTRDQP